MKRAALKRSTKRMKRSPIKRRKTDIARKNRPKSNTRIKPVNHRRKAKRDEERYGGEYGDWIRRQPCEACLELAPMEMQFDLQTDDSRKIAAHAQHTQGNGGRWWVINTFCAGHEKHFHSPDGGRNCYGLEYDEILVTNLERFFWATQKVRVNGAELMAKFEEELLRTGRVPKVPGLAA